MEFSQDPVITAPAGARVVASVGPVEPIDLLASERGPLSLARRLSWGAIFAGAAVASVTAIVLNIIGLAIGLAAFDPFENQAMEFGIGAGIWVFLTSFFSMLAGGYVAGWATAMPAHRDRGLHGVVTWSVATLIGLGFVTAGASRAVSGAASLIAGIGHGAAPAIGQAAQQMLPPDIQRDVQTFVTEAREDPALRASIVDVTMGDATPAERERLVDEIGQRTGKSREEVDRTLQDWTRRAHETKATVARKTEKAATKLSWAAFLGVSSMLLGLASSTIGAIAAVPAGTPSGVFTRRRTVAGVTTAAP